VADWIPLKAGGRFSLAERPGWLVVAGWLQDEPSPDDCFPGEPVLDDSRAGAWADSAADS
jgi:hypothetical protein